MREEKKKVYIWLIRKVFTREFNQENESSIAYYDGVAGNMAGDQRQQGKALRELGKGEVGTWWEFRALSL